MATYSPVTDLVITTAGISDGSGQKGANVDNTADQWQKIYWWIRLSSGAGAPTADAIVTVYAYQNDNFAPEFTTDGLAKTDTVIPSKPENAKPIGSIVFTADASKFFYGSGVWRNPGAEGWSIGIFNETGAALSGNEVDGFVHWQGEKA